MPDEHIQGFGVSRYHAVRAPQGGLLAAPGACEKRTMSAEAAGGALPVAIMWDRRDDMARFNLDSHVTTSVLAPLCFFFHYTHCNDNKPRAKGKNTHTMRIAIRESTFSPFNSKMSPMIRTSLTRQADMISHNKRKRKCLVSGRRRSRRTLTVRGAGPTQSH